MKTNELKQYKKHRDEVILTNKNGPGKEKKTYVSPDR